MKSYYVLYTIFCFVLLGTSGYAQVPGTSIKATGVLVDKNNKPVPGVSILVQEKTSGIESAADGSFTVECS
ncbi:MAG: hypothetical protein KA160_07530, partial [Lacibacter sp.]|nr:hypothetical protein [Lacibacter sp.]